VRTTLPCLAPADVAHDLPGLPPPACSFGCLIVGQQQLCKSRQAAPEARAVEVSAGLLAPGLRRTAAPHRFPSESAGRFFQRSGRISSADVFAIHTDCAVRVINSSSPPPCLRHPLPASHCVSILHMLTLVGPQLLLPAPPVGLAVGTVVDTRWAPSCALDLSVQRP